MRRNGVVVFGVGVVLFASTLLVFFGRVCGLESASCAAFLVLGTVLGIPAIGIGAALMFTSWPSYREWIPENWKPQNWKEWVGLFAESALVILFLAFWFPTLVTETTVWLGLAMLLFIAAAVTVTLFAFSRWVLRKLKTKFAAERLPKLPKEP